MPKDYLRVQIKASLYAEYIGEQGCLYGPSVSYYNIHCNVQTGKIPKRLMSDFKIGSTVSMINLKKVVSDVFIGQCRVSI